MSLFGKLYELFVGAPMPHVEAPKIPSMPHLSLPTAPKEPRRLTTRELIQRESEIGGTLFGEVPQGYRREFFNLDPTTWIWHEEWYDQKRQRQTTTTRYEVHENGVLKAQEGARYNFIEGQELENFMLATRMYYDKVARDIYRCDPATGQRLQARAA